MTQLEQALGYTFREPKLLETALTHSSYANENKKLDIACNERLEFLGDAVLGQIVAEWLFRNFSEVPEGKMTRTRAELVCENSLAESSIQLGVGDALRLGKGEEQGGGRQRRSILADAFEAILAAVYLDGGRKPAEEIVGKFILEKMKGTIDVSVTDYKTRLQERLQRKKGQTVEYVLVGESGPDHSKEFTSEVRINGVCAGVGIGRSKKVAEQAAAREALEALEA